MRHTSLWTNSSKWRSSLTSLGSMLEPGQFNCHMVWGESPDQVLFNSYDLPWHLQIISWILTMKYSGIFQLKNKIMSQDHLWPTSKLLSPEAVAGSRMFPIVSSVNRTGCHNLPILMLLCNYLLRSTVLGCGHRHHLYVYVTPKWHT